MLYKTMVLEMLRDRRPLHEKLRQEKILLGTMEFYARELKARHEAWKQQLSEMRPGSDPSQIASEALEIALKELEDSLPSDSSTEDADRPSLDDCMISLRDHTPPV